MHYNTLWIRKREKEREGERAAVDVKEMERDRNGVTHTQSLGKRQTRKI